jgi:TrkA-C domain
MTAAILQRLTREVRITASGLQEAVLAVSERVNRRVQILRLHWQAASLHRQIVDAHRMTGIALCDLPQFINATLSETESEMRAETQLRQSAGSIRVLRAELATIEGAIRELEIEALHEHFIQFQQDLLTRNANILRLAVAESAPIIGQAAGAVQLPGALRVAAVLRGPVLLPSHPPVPIRAGDIVIILGPQPELSGVIPFIAGTGRVEPVGAL